MRTEIATYIVVGIGKTHEEARIDAEARRPYWFDEPDGVHGEKRDAPGGETVCVCIMLFERIRR